MSKLKAHRILGMNEECACIENDFYLKSEADKVIAELNRKIKLYEDLGSCKKGCLALRHNQRRVESEIYRVKLKEKEILRHKYKRCLAMAQVLEHVCPITNRKAKWRKKWYQRWLELAEKFKDAK